jgi:hypothetical protein
MPHGFTVETDTTDHLRFGKTHENGEKTVVDVQRDIPGEDWRVTVRDPRGNLDLGAFQTKREARTRASQFMADNPKGVPAQDRNIAGAGGGIPGMGGEGIF